MYLVTVSGLLPETLAQHDALVDTATLTRDGLGQAVLKSFDEAVGGEGRPRTREESVVRKLAVFRETHEDNTPHFHVAIALVNPRAWGPAKRILRERDGIPSHWSCSHTQFWSALRYGVMPSLKKPTVDDSPWAWTKAGAGLSLRRAPSLPWDFAFVGC